MSTANIIVLCSFAAYMVIMIIIGFVSSKGTKNNEDYFLGGRNLGGWTAALSAQASDMSGWLLMGLPGSVYLAGTGEVWIAVGLLIGTILNWYIVSARLRKYTIVAGNSLTIPSFFQNRYRDDKGVIKMVSAIIIAIFFTVYTASAFSSGAKLFATLFGNSENYNTVYTIGLIVAVIVILVYTFLGGFKAVCYTDFIQGLLMLVAIMAVPIIAYVALTYNNSFSQSLIDSGVTNPDNYLNFFKNDDGSNVSAVSIISNLAWGLGYFGMPHILIRFMAVKSDSEIKKSRKIAIVWVIISLAASCLIGLVARAPTRSLPPTSFTRRSGARTAWGMCAPCRCTSTTCAARSSRTPQSRCTCAMCGARAMCSARKANRSKQNNSAAEHFCGAVSLYTQSLSQHTARCSSTGTGSTTGGCMPSR